MKYNIILLITLVNISLTLFSTEIEIYYNNTNDDESTNQLELQQQYGIDQYETEIHGEDTMAISFPAVLGGGVVLGRSIASCILCCMGDSCGKACNESWVGSAANGCQAYNWTLTGLTLCCFATTACCCAQRFNKNCFNCCKKIKKRDGLHTKVIEFEEVYK